MKNDVEILFYTVIYFIVFIMNTRLNIPFSLIKHNMARVLEYEIQSIHHQNSSVYLLNTWIKIMKQEGLNDGLLI